MAGKPISRLLPAGGCKGITKQGKPCQGKDIFENGYCKHHGGKGKSLQARRFALVLEEAKRIAARSRQQTANWLKRNPEIAALLERRRAKSDEVRQTEAD